MKLLVMLLLGALCSMGCATRFPRHSSPPSLDGSQINVDWNREPREQIYVSGHRRDGTWFEAWHGLGPEYERFVALSWDQLVGIPLHFSSSISRGMLFAWTHESNWTIDLITANAAPKPTLWRTVSVFDGRNGREVTEEGGETGDRRRVAVAMEVPADAGPSPWPISTTTLVVMMAGTDPVRLPACTFASVCTHGEQTFVAAKRETPIGQDLVLLTSPAGTIASLPNAEIVAVGSSAQGMYVLARRFDPQGKPLGEGVYNLDLSREIVAPVRGLRRVERDDGTFDFARCETRPSGGEMWTPLEPTTWRPREVPSEVLTLKPLVRRVVAGVTATDAPRPEPVVGWLCQVTTPAGPRWTCLGMHEWPPSSATATWLDVRDVPRAPGGTAYLTSDGRWGALVPALTSARHDTPERAVEGAVVQLLEDRYRKLLDAGQTHKAAAEAESLAAYVTDPAERALWRGRAARWGATVMVGGWRSSREIRPQPGDPADLGPELTPAELPLLRHALACKVLSRYSSPDAARTADVCKFLGDERALGLVGMHAAALANVEKNRKSEEVARQRSQAAPPPSSSFFSLGIIRYQTPVSYVSNDSVANGAIRTAGQDHDRLRQIEVDAARNVQRDLQYTPGYTPGR